MTYIRFCAALALTASLAFSQNIDSTRLRYTAPQGGVQRSGQAKWSDVISVKDFGAFGDGTNDDTPAFQAAVNAIPSGTLGTIYCPATANSYRLNTNVVSTGRSPLFLLSYGCTLTGTGTLPANTFVKYDALGNLILPAGITTTGAITAGGPISATGGVSAGGPITGTTGTYSGALTTTALTTTTGPVVTPSLQQDATTNTIKVYDKNAVQQFLFSSPYFLLGNPASTRLIGFYNAASSNTLSLYDWTAAANIANYSSTQIELFPNVKFDSSINSPITATGLITSQAGGFKFPDNTTQTSAGIQPSSSNISTNTAVSASGSKNQMFSATGTITVTLYNATLVPGGIITVQNAGTGTITINPQAGQTINGLSSAQLIRQFDSYTLQVVNGNWVLI